MCQSLLYADFWWIDDIFNFNVMNVALDSSTGYSRSRLRVSARFSRYIKKWITLRYNSFFFNVIFCSFCHLCCLYYRPLLFILSFVTICIVVFAVRIAVFYCSLPFILPFFVVYVILPFFCCSYYCLLPFVLPFLSFMSFVLPFLSFISFVLPFFVVFSDFSIVIHNHA